MTCSLLIKFLSSFKMRQFVFIFWNVLLAFTGDWIIFGSDLETCVLGHHKLLFCAWKSSSVLPVFWSFKMARHSYYFLKCYFETWKYKKMTLKSFSNFSLPDFTIWAKESYACCDTWSGDNNQMFRSVFEFIWELHENYWE